MGPQGGGEGGDRSRLRELPKDGAPCIRIGVQEGNFVFDNFLHFYDYIRVQLAI